MKLSVTRLVTVSAFAVALGLGASQASAQKATFNLPFAARWGSTVLDPGNYTLRVSDTLSAIHTYYLQSESGTKMAVSGIVNYGPASGRSYLKLVNVDGTFYVKEYVSGASGTATQFAVPKANHRELTTQDHVLLAFN